MTLVKRRIIPIMAKVAPSAPSASPVWKRERKIIAIRVLMALSIVPTFFGILILFFISDNYSIAIFLVRRWEWLRMGLAKILNLPTWSP